MLKNKETYEIMDAESIGLAKVRPSLSIRVLSVCIGWLVVAGSGWGLNTMPWLRPAHLSHSIFTERWRLLLILT